LEAVEKFMASPVGYYDIIFMDVQMPIMDGFTASKTIRESTHLNAESIFIIAMTANVFKEDIDAAMEAGMNLHLGKPIEISLFHKSIGDYIQKNPSKILEPLIIVEQEPVKQPLEKAPYNEYVDFENGLKRLMGKTKLYQKLLLNFVKFENIEILQNALKARDIEGIKREVHTLKGLASNLGINKLVLICSSMETDLKEGFLIEYDLLIDEIQQAAHQTKIVIEEYVNEN
ncbi:MAG: response regulator, partial [Oscillospiraceae bacterium]